MALNIAGGAACYNCGKSGHIQRDCPDADNKLCYRCGFSGHIARECPEKGDDDRKCYNCGMGGHISRDCPEAGNDDGGPRGGGGGRGACYR